MSACMCECQLGSMCVCVCVSEIRGTYMSSLSNQQLVLKLNKYQFQFMLKMALWPLK